MSGMDWALRRITIVAPVSRWAKLATRAAWLSLLLALAAIVAGHSHGALARFFAVLTLRADGRPDPAVALVLLSAALLVAALALGLAVAAAVSIWVKGRRGVTRILATCALIALFLPYPAFLIFRAGVPPWLSEISTDLDDPPVFATDPDRVAARGFEPRALEPGQREAQQDAYPDVTTIMLDMEMDEAFKAAREAVKSAGFRVIAETMPGGAQRPDGLIEALGFSPALHLPIAVAIRLRPGEDAVKVDLRTAIFGLPNDLGAGADFYGKFSDALDDRDDDG